MSYLSIDRLSLSSYQEGKEVSLRDVKCRLMIIAREDDHVIPRHYLRLVSDSSFRGISTKSQLFIQGLTQLANDFLEWRNNRIYVKIEKFNAWQEQIAHIPPMLLICALIFKNLVSTINSIGSHSSYNQATASNLGNTSLIPSYIPQLEESKKGSHGLNDLHIYLNDTVETDTLWLDFLHYPDSFHREILESSNGNEPAKEQYEQFDNWTKPGGLKTLIEKAIELRKKLFSKVNKVV